VPQDDAEAAKWFHKAADQGDAVAQFNLGAMYDTGKGVPQDDAEAAKWFHKAAYQGNTDAKHNLDVMSANPTDQSRVSSNGPTDHFLNQPLLVPYPGPASLTVEPENTGVSVGSYVFALLHKGHWEPADNNSWI